MDQNLFGYWKMTAMRWKREDGQWENEKVFGGSSIFTSGGLISTFTRGEIAFGYSGTFAVRGNDLVITPEVASIPEIEGSTIIRTVKSVGAESLTLTMTDAATGRFYEIDFKLLTRKLQ